MTLLALATVGLVLVLVAVLVAGLVGISRCLRSIGGPGMTYLGAHQGDVQSGLAKVRWGLRAIERHTETIGPGVGRLNEVLQDTASELGSVETRLDDLLAAVTRQEGAS